MYTVYWCVSECWAFSDNDPDANGMWYGAVEEVVEVIENIDYNIGQNGGQFILGIKYSDYAK